MATRLTICAPPPCSAIWLWPAPMAACAICYCVSKIDVLVIDDWAMNPLNETERRDFWEICEDRYQARSLILTSQLPVAKWHEQIGDATVAEGILDRIVHCAHRIDLKGDSLRKNPPKPSIPKSSEATLPDPKPSS